MLQRKEERVAGVIQGDIPLTSRPFAEIGRVAGISEGEVIKTIRDLLRRGIIRRFGAVLRHQRAGITGNAMVLWAVPPSRCEEVGRILARFTEVSHCYERTPPFAGRYNIFTLVHLRGGDVGAAVEKMIEAAGIADCRILASVEEYKKESMEFFR